MRIRYNCILFKAEPGQNISRFAEEAINYRDEYFCLVIAVFNDIYIEVDETMTAKDIVHQYLKKWAEL